MRLSAPAALLALTTPILARLETIYAPATVHPTEGFNLIFENFNYIINNQQFAVAVGEKPQGSGADHTMGQLLGSFYLGPDFSNSLGNHSKWLSGYTPTLPSPGPAMLVFEVFSAYGAAWGPVIESFAVNVTYGSGNSNQMVASQRV